MEVVVRNIREGEDNRVGVLRLHAGRIVAEPADDPLLQGILSHPVADHARGVLHDATGEPKSFLRALHQQYTSPYLRCSPVLEDGGGDTVRKSHGDSEASPSALAEHYASLWNTLQAHGEDVPDEELQAASDELSGADWCITCKRDGEWVAHHYTDRAPFRSWKGHEPSVEKKAEHAPKGGISAETQRMLDALDSPGVVAEITEMLSQNNIPDVEKESVIKSVKNLLLTFS